MKLYPAERLNMGISAGAVAASFAIASPHFAGSLAIGAALETMNFRFLHRTGEELFAGVVSGSGPWVVVLALRLSFMFAGIVVAMLGGADPLALIIGLSLVMPATVAAAIWHRPEVVPHELNPAIDPEDPVWDGYSVWRPGRDVARREEDETNIMNTIDPTSIEETK